MKKRIMSMIIIWAFMLLLIAPAKIEAATIKISKAKATMEVDSSLTLKVTGTDTTPTWKSSKKSVATVSKKGYVKAKAEGKVTITATVNKKKYKCVVTVVDSNKVTVTPTPTPTPKETKPKATPKPTPTPKVEEKEDMSKGDGVYIDENGLAVPANESGRPVVEWSGSNTESKGRIGAVVWISGIGVQINGVVCPFPGITASLSGVLEDYAYMCNNSIIRNNFPNAKDMTAQECLDWLEANYEDYWEECTEDFGTLMAIYAYGTKIANEGYVVKKSDGLSKFLLGINSEYDSGPGRHFLSF